MLSKLGVAALVTLPLVAGCYAEAYPAGYYARPSYVRVYGPPRVYYGPPRAVVVAPPPPRVRVYW
jgi:hypothetical protein